MVLRNRVVIILTLLACTVVLLQTGIGRFLIIPRFAALDQQQAETDRARVEQALAGEATAIADGCRDWAAWEELANYLRKPSDDFAAKSLGPEAFVDLRLNLIQLYDTQGRLVFSDTRDATRGQPLTLAGLPPQGLGRKSPALAESLAGHPTAGLIAAGEEVLAVAASPVTGVNRRQKPLGVLVLGRVLGADLLDRVRAQTSVEFALVPPPADGGVPAPEVAYSDVNQTEVLRVLSVLVGLDGKPVATLRSETPRTLMRYGRLAIFESAAFVLLSSCLMLAAAWFAFHQWVLRPVQRLVQYSGCATHRLELPELIERRAAEAGHVQTNFDALVQLVSDGVVLVSTETERIIDANPRFADMVGCRQDEIYGQPLTDFLFLSRRSDAATDDAHDADDRPQQAFLRRQGGEGPVLTTVRDRTLPQSRVRVLTVRLALPASPQPAALVEVVA